MYTLPHPTFTHNWVPPEDANTAIKPGTPPFLVLSNFWKPLGSYNMSFGMVRIDPSVWSSLYLVKMHSKRVYFLSLLPHEESEDNRCRVSAGKLQLLQAKRARGKERSSNDPA